MMKRTKSFTLVEVLLAMGVCAIGICSIMVLFPVGASASRDAAARTYVANFADDLLHFKQYQISLPGGWATLVDGQGIKRPEDVDIASFREQKGNLELTTVNSGTLRTIIQNYDSSGPWEQSPDMKQFNPGMYERRGSPEIFQIVAKRGKNGDYENNSDFRCIAVLWQEALPGGIPMATRLKLEVSWPAEIPYNQRQKSIFTLELFKNNR